MRILISAGGTGGHVYPALAAAELLISDFGLLIDKAQSSINNQQSAILWVGTAGGLEGDLVRRAGLDFTTIHGGGLHGVGWRTPLNAARLAAGFWEAWGIVRRFRPGALFVTGGYAAIPVALAGWLSRVPILVYLPDIEPALAVRFLARLARRVAVTSEASRGYLPAHKVVVTGYPIRAGLRAATRAEAVREFGLEPELKTLLVFGGSRGARSLNRATLAALPELLAGRQIIHITGPLDWEEVRARRDLLPEAERARYHIFSYLHEAMGLALGAADLVVSRAGASALGEFPLFGLPAVLVPYPHAWRYQKVNADWLVERGAAIRLDDQDLNERLAETVKALFADPARLEVMRARSRALAVPAAADHLASLLAALARGGKSGWDDAR